MRTKNAVSNHPVLALTTTLTAFVVMYFAVFGTGVMYMLKLVSKGPGAYVPPELGSDGLHGTPLNQRPARSLAPALDHVDPAIDTSAEA